MTDRINTAKEREKLAAFEGHTPGPWTEGCDFEWWLDTDGEIAYTVVGSQDEPVAVVAVEEAFGLDGLLEANARLIAAAPDLRDRYAAALDEIERLREALDAIEVYTSDTLQGPIDPRDDTRDWQRTAVVTAYRRARAALNPEGET